MLGGLLAVLASATFALSNVLARRGVITGSVVLALVVTVPIGVPLFLLAAALAGSLGAVGDFSGAALAFLAAGGIVHFVLGRYCNYRAINAMGSNLAAPVQQTSLLFALVLALLALGESITPLRMLGIVLVMAGPAVILHGQRRGGHKTTASGFAPRLAEGYVFAFLSAAGYGISPVLVRAGLAGSDIATSIAGGLVSYVAAALVVLPLMARRAARRGLGGANRQAVAWFFGSGLATCVSQMVRYMALALAPVTVVASIMRISLVFRYIFSWILNRDYEIFGLRVVIGILVSLIGALCLTVDAGFLISLLALPQGAGEFLRLSWRVVGP